MIADSLELSVISNSLGSGILARENQKRILITGAPRSGTTWLGKLLEVDGKSSIFMEPLSKIHGLSAIRHWFPLGDGSNFDYSDIIDDFMCGRTARFRAFYPGRSFLKAAASLFVADSRQRAFRKAVDDPPEFLVIKDPIASMSARQLITRYNFSVVFMIKHPLAFYDSLLRVGWDSTEMAMSLIDQSGKQKKRADDHDLSTAAGRASFIWCAINEEGLELSRDHPDNVTLVFHENLCLNPIGEIESILDRIGMPGSARTSDYLRHSTTGAAVRPDPGAIHVLERNAAALPERWRDHVSVSDQNIILDRTRKLREQLYPPVPADRCGR